MSDLTNEILINIRDELRGTTPGETEATETAQVRRARDLLDEIRQKSLDVERDLLDIGDPVGRLELQRPAGRAAVRSADLLAALVLEEGPDAR